MANLETEQPVPDFSMSKTVLHVGCGPKRADKLHPLFRAADWREVRVDIDPAVKPEIVASIVAMPQIANDSVDAVWSSHNLEHLYAHEVPLALREFLRVLRPGGFVLLTMPNLQKLAKFIAQGKLHEPIYQSPAGPIATIAGTTIWLTGPGFPSRH